MKIVINRNSQSGYTILEFMIAGVLGLIILLAVMQVYLGSTQTNRMQAGIIEVQDGGRFALSYLEKELQRAGWSNLDPGINLGTLDSHINFSATTTTNSTGYNNSDSITIRYQADTETGVDVEYDCSGNEVAHSSEIVNSYIIFNGSLICNANGIDIAAMDKDNSKEILKNVESLQILYGVESLIQQDGIVDAYIRADQVLTGGYEELVIAIRLAVFLRSSNDILGHNNTNSYTILDTVFAAQNDRKLRRLYVKTVLLPNRPQAF